MPPVFVLKEEAVKKILSKKGLTDIYKKQILKEYRLQKVRMEQILEKNIIEDRVSIIPEEEYYMHPLGLAIPGHFLERDIVLTYEEYRNCLDTAVKYAEEHENYQIVIDEKKQYRNIQIMIHKGKWCMISKGKAPVINFVMQHPKLVYAFENLFVPIVDE